MKSTANVIDQTVTDRFALYHGDCVEVLRGLPKHSAHYSVFSPPFSSLYTYSNSPRDIGNVRNDAEFFAHFGYVIEELARVMVPGRLVSMHTMLLPTSKERDGYIGLRDFRGDLIRAFQARGFVFHSEVVIWKDPVTAMQRTKALGLLHKTVRENASMSRQGIPDYLVTLRAPGECPRDQRVTHTADEYPVSIWQNVASPVWMDIDPQDTLQYQSAREHDDERHICLAVGSLVLTRRGFVSIEKVVVGDEALTHMGRWRKVIVSRSTGVRPVVRIAAQGVPCLRLTPDHKVWPRGDGKASRARDAAEKSEPGWVEAQHSSGRYVNLKLPPTEPTKYDDVHWWTVGRWLADGCWTPRGGVQIACGKHKAEAMKTGIGRFGGNPLHDTGTCYQILLRDPDRVLRSTIEQCGEFAHGKRLPPEAFTLPVESARALLEGYLSGDGHMVKSRNRWMASTASRELAMGIAMLAQRVFGTIASVHAGRGPGKTIIDGREVNTRQEWVVSFDGPGKRRQTPFVLDDGAWKKVRSSDHDGEAETWNLRVEDDESFTAEGCVVKNCPLQLEVIRRGVELWSNPGEVVLSPFAGIGSEGHIALGGATTKGARVKPRRFVGAELKDSYYRQAAENLTRAAAGDRQVSMGFDADLA